MNCLLRSVNRSVLANARRHTLARPFAIFACVTLIANLLGFSGCASPVAPNGAHVPVRRDARIEMINLSDCDWRITVASPDGREIRALRLPAGEKLSFELAGGTYAITQTALSGFAGPSATRRFPAQLESGEIYRWQLATLLTLPAEIGP